MTASSFPASFTRAMLYGSVLSLLLVACTTSDEQPKASTELDKNALVRLADRMRLQGDSGMAAEFYQRAIAEDPKNVAAYHGLATMLQTTGDSTGAERAYREALRYDAQNGDILRDYAKLLLAGGNYTAATAQYRAALASNGKDIRALNGLGVALDQAGDHKAAQEQYRAVLAQNPDDMAALNNLGMSLIMAGDYNGAIQQLAPVAETFKATEGLRQNLALAYAKAGQAQPALNAIAPPAQYMDFTRTTPPAEPMATPAALATNPVVPSPPAPAAIAATLAMPTAALPSVEPVIAQPVITTSVAPSVAAPVAPVAAIMHAVPASPPREEVALPSLTEPESQPLSIPRWKERRLSTLRPTPAVLAQAMPLASAPPVVETAAVPAVVAMVTPMAQPSTVVTPDAKTAAVTPPDSRAQPTPSETVPAIAASETTMSQQRRRVTAGGAFTNIAFRSLALPAALPMSLPQRAVFGPYATDGIAQAQQARLQQQLVATLPAKSVSNIVTQLTAEGTPEFSVHVYGFMDAEALANFCARAAAAGYACQVN